MNSKKHRILTSLCLLTMLALLVGCTNNSSSTPETICGTYTSGEAEFQKILAVDQNNQVYYADQKNDCFILGEVRQQKGDSYLISCQSSNYGDRIPDQEFTYDGKGFAITIQGERFEFEKIDDIPSVIRGCRTLLLTQWNRNILKTETPPLFQETSSGAAA